MDCLIELYDHEQLNNLVDILAFRPKKVVFLYDTRETQYEDVHAIELACRTKLPSLHFDYVPINTLNLDDIRDTCKKVIWQNPNCYVDITGGGELSAIGAYLACRDTFTPIFKVDVVNGTFINAYGCKSLEEGFTLPKLSLDVLLLAHGAAFGGFGHPKPPKALHLPLLSFCQHVFQNISRWKELCFYLQTACSLHSSPHHPLSFFAPREIVSSGGKSALPEEDFLCLAQQLGLIQGLRLTHNKVSFTFINDAVKKYMTDFGTWLELFTYISLYESQCFDDVRLSVKVDWNGMRQIPVEVTNEIDVTFFSGIHPVFVSCKLSEPSSEALQELSVYKSYFGGRHSRCILVTLGKINPERSYPMWRAREMGIELIDGNAICEGRFLEEIHRAIHHPYRSL